MPEEFVFVLTFLLIFSGAAFILTAWIHASILRLNPSRVVKSTGKLVGFRRHYRMMGPGDNHVDYLENRPGRVPVVWMDLDGEMVEISAAWADYELTGEDIGKQVPVIYQRKLGVILLIDGEKPIRDYLGMKRIIFWALMSVGVVMVAFGIAVAVIF